MRELATIGLRLTLLVGVLGVSLLAGELRPISVQSTFATNGVNLRIDSKGWYNGAAIPSATWALKDLTPGVDKFFNFNDIKPGDYGREVISMHVKNTSSWLCLDFTNLTNDENVQIEPEWDYDDDGDDAGELTDGMEFFGWRDDGDGVFEVGEKPLFGTSTQSASIVLDDTSYVVGDSGGGGACGVNETRYVGLYWCAGNLFVHVPSASITCDGSTLGNDAQTDQMSVDVSIRALPSKDNPKFMCGKKPPHYGGHDDDDDDHGYGHYTWGKYDYKKKKYTYTPPKYSWSNVHWYGRN
ncbi:MAG: hypothetical protein AAB573_03040 [Patescibacteria group bacterium]